MSPCYQGHTNRNEKEKKATHNEMQSNTKHKFECYKGQGMGKTTNRMHIKINLATCLKNEAR
jgi:hypothetical protein